MTAPLLIVAAVWALVFLGLWLVLRGWMGRQRVRERIFAVEEADAAPDPTEERRGFLTRWLFLAGFRSRRAAPMFVGATLALTAVGLGFVWLMHALGTVDQFVYLLAAVPGGVGEVFLPFAYLAPWISCGLLAGLPTLYVRAVRKRRVEQVEQDLPVTLDLLATLAEAGLGFDAAVDRILAAQPAGRPLAREFRTFQYDLLAGRPRIESLRRLGRRVDVTWFTIFISAVVQAEQIGSGLAGVLRMQANDLRERRRERALAFAMAIPVKLLFPLIVCFLPGIFVAATGPTLYQIVQMIDKFLQPFQG